MKPLFTAKSPFENPPKVKEKIQWIEPKLVCEVAYAEITADEQLRQATFRGLARRQGPEGRRFRAAVANQLILGARWFYERQPIPASGEKELTIVTSGNFEVRYCPPIEDRD